MRARTTRSRLAVGIAVLAATALGTTGASAAQATGAPTAKAVPTTVVSGGTAHGTSKGGDGGLKKLKGAALGVDYRPTAQAPGDVNTADRAFAACMRGQGQSVFPRFHASKGSGGGIRLKVNINGRDFDPTSKGHRKAIKACGPILKKAGISFPSAPALPPLPEPGKAGDPGAPGEKTSSLNTEKGPGVTTSLESS